MLFYQKEIPPHLRDCFEPAECGKCYICKLVEVFEEVRRVLKPTGTLWLNISDTYAGSNKGSDGSGGFSVKSKIQLGNKGSFVQPTKLKNYKAKDLIGVPWMLAFALRNAGWYLRQDIIWAKPNPMPESVRDRCTKSHEYIFLLSKSPKYYYDYKAILEPAAYDGRKDTYFKGSNKYKNGFAPFNGFAPENTNIQSFAKKGHERWSNKIIGRTETKMQGTGYAGDGSGLHKHSGYYDGDGKLRMNIDENGIPARNKRSVWTVSTKPFSSGDKNVDHYAVYPEELIIPCIKAGCPKQVCNKCGKPREKIYKKIGTEKVPPIGGVKHRKNGNPTYSGNTEKAIKEQVGLTDCGCCEGFSGGIVLDPFSGVNTTGIVARKLNRNFVSIELNPNYIKMANKRMEKELGMFI